MKALCGGAEGQAAFLWTSHPITAFSIAAFALTAIPRTLVATVEPISDGDALMALSSNGTKLRIRLLGIDAPENAHGTRTP